MTVRPGKPIGWPPTLASVRPHGKSGTAPGSSLRMCTFAGACKSAFGEVTDYCAVAPIFSSAKVQALGRRQGSYSSPSMRGPVFELPRKSRTGRNDGRILLAGALREAAPNPSIGGRPRAPDIASRRDARSGRRFAATRSA